MLDLPPANPGIEISIANQGMSKGLAQTDGPQFIPKALLQFGPIQLGGQWKNVTSTVAEGEGAAFVSWQGEVSDAHLGLGATFKFQSAVVEPTDDKAFELHGFIGRKWGNVGVHLSAVYSPDDFGSTKQSLYIDGGPSYDITKTLRISANIGRRERRDGSDYTSFNAGISKEVGKFTFDARYYDTAQSELGEIYHGRGVLSGKLAF